MTIRIARPHLGQEEIKNVIDVMMSGNIAAGKFVRMFEEMFSGYTEKAHAIATSSGTTAQLALIRSISKQPGEYIVPAFSFFSTASMVLAAHRRNTIKFADIIPDTATIDPISVSDLITPKTIGVIVVNLYGMQAKHLGVIRELCDDYNLKLITDACQSPAPWAAQLADAAFLSFYATKNITTGEGGMVITDDSGLAKRVRMMIDHGQSEKYTHRCIGYNFRMHELAGAIGTAQFGRLDQNNARRVQIARKYRMKLEQTAKNYSFQEHSDTHVYHQFVIRMASGGVYRDRFRNALRDEGIETAVHYPKPIPRQPVFRKHFNGKCTQADIWANHVVSIPCHPGLTDDEVDRVIHAINNYFKGDTSTKKENRVWFP